MLDGRFIPSGCGNIFISCWKNTTQADTAILCVPPLAEELNCSRRHIALQCEQLCEAGFDSYIMDYYGTGDSEGEFSEASLEIWQQDIDAAYCWVKQQGYKRIVLWGVRFGAILIARYLSDKPADGSLRSLLFWQPVEQGQQIIRAMTRLKSLQLGKGAVNETDNPYLDVAGYRYNNQFIADIESLTLSDYSAVLERFPVCWLVISRQSESSGRLVERYPDVQKWAEVNAAPFWMIPEMTVQQELLEATQNSLIS